MKKQALAAALAVTMSMPVMADALGIFAGVDYHRNKTSLKNNSIDRSVNDSNNMSGYIAVEHFIPLIPNVKLKYSDLSNDDLNYSSSAMNGILYYQLFDNDLFEADAGIAYTNINGFNKTANLAQVYGAAKVHILGSGVHAFAEIIGGSLTDDNALDTNIGFAYTVNPESNLLNFAVRAGYRIQKIEFKNNSKTQKNNGLFAGVEVHF